MSYFQFQRALADVVSEEVSRASLIEAFAVWNQWDQAGPMRRVAIIRNSSGWGLTEARDFCEKYSQDELLEKFIDFQIEAYGSTKPMTLTDKIRKALIHRRDEVIRDESSAHSQLLHLIEDLEIYVGKLPPSEVRPSTK